ATWIEAAVGAAVEEREKARIDEQALALRAAVLSHAAGAGVARQRNAGHAAEILLVFAVAAVEAGSTGRRTARRLRLFALHERDRQALALRLKGVRRLLAVRRALGDARIVGARRTRSVLARALTVGLAR